MKKHLLLLFFLTVPFLLSSQQLTRKQAFEAAGKVFSERFGEVETAFPDYELIPVSGNNTQTAYYVFNFINSKGFIAISAHKAAYPLLAYSNRSNFKKENIHPGASGFFINYKDQISYIQDHDLQPTAKIAQAWDHYLKNGMLRSHTMSVTPLMQSQWDQGCYYNDSCPADASMPSYYCGHVPAGCVATAMAQILYFHKYPAQGTGSYSYNDAAYGMQQANFTATTYQYALMPGVVTNTNPNVAQLIYHCGVASHMNYGAGSATTAVNAKNAFVNHFNYASNIALVSKFSYTNASWEALLRSELDSARPVFYSGHDPNGPDHAFVCDGYQFNNHFHFNWGWGGQYNGYYYLSSLNPGTFNYTSNQEAIIRIKSTSPLPVAHFTVSSTSIAMNGTLDFTDLSSGNPTSWQWVFYGANPSQSSQQHPTNISYPNTGNYDVRLIVSNAAGTDTLLKQAYIQVSNDLPEVNFYSNAIAVPVGGQLNFYDNTSSTSAITSRNWYFEGGTPGSSTDENPAGITYTSPGIYDVSLTASNGNGSDHVLKEDYVIVYQSCDTLFYYSVPNYTINTTYHPNFIMAREDLDGLTPLYASAGHTSNWMTLISSDQNNQYRGATSMFSPAGQANNWLEFGPLSLGTGYQVIYWDHSYMEMFMNKRDGYSLKANSSGISSQYYPYTSLFSLDDNDEKTMNDSSWTRYYAKVDPLVYTNADLYFAFHHHANDMSYLFLDNIHVVHYEVPLQGVETPSGIANAILYPNPASAYIIFKSELLSADGQQILIEISNTHGVLVQKMLIHHKGTEIKIPLNMLEEGIYLLSIKGENHLFNGKFVLL